MLHPKPSGTHQPLPRQTGPQVILNEPNEGLLVRQDSQKAVAANVLTIPLSSICGTLLIRSGQSSIDYFSAAISEEFPYPRSIFVPIDLPLTYARAIKSAARRALGPMLDVQERSGVVFTMRAIGARGAEKKGATAEGGEDNDDVVSVHSEQSEVGEGQADGAQDPDLGAMPIDTMSQAQLQRTFGRSALDVVGAMWQHQSKIAEQARFMTKEDMISFITASGRKSVMRRSQVSPTVIYSALRSSISTSAVAIASHDTFIQLAGGTPEGIVAGIMMGFQKAIYVTTTAKEYSWMSLPSLATEYANKVDYLNYVSPDPDDPERGFLAAEAIKLLIPYIRNFVMDNKEDIMIPPPFPIDVPPLQTFTYIAVTGRVVARTILNPHATPKKMEKKTQNLAEEDTHGGPGSASGTTLPPKPQISGKIVVKVTGKKKSEIEEEDAEEGGDEDAEDDGEDEHEEEEDDISVLEKLEQASSTPKKPVSKAKAAGGLKRKVLKPKGAPKKKAKGE